MTFWGGRNIPHSSKLFPYTNFQYFSHLFCCCFSGCFGVSFPWFFKDTCWLGWQANRLENKGETGETGWPCQESEVLGSMSTRKTRRRRKIRQRKIRKRWHVKLGDWGLFLTEQLSSSLFGEDFFRVFNVGNIPSSKWSLCRCARRWVSPGTGDVKEQAAKDERGRQQSYLNIKLTYPTKWEKENHLWKCQPGGDMLVSWRYLNILCMIFFCAFLFSPSQSDPENSLQRHWLVGIEHYLVFTLKLGEIIPNFWWAYF